MRTALSDLRPGPDYLAAALGGANPSLVDGVRATIGAGLVLRLGLGEIVRLVEGELAGAPLDLPGLAEHLDLLRQTDRPVERWWDPAWRRLAGRPAARPSRRQRLAILVETVAMAAVNRARLADSVARAAANPDRSGGLAIARVPSHHCPACAWEQTRYGLDELDRLPPLPAHPGCRCRYVLG